MLEEFRGFLRKERLDSAKWAFRIMVAGIAGGVAQPLAELIRARPTLGLIVLAAFLSMFWLLDVLIKFATRPKSSP